ncbi:MAG TPA: pyruvate dehydrogenase complex dihydrolipoamide acetyltransferase [Gemmatimonadaceae bacterium]|nr:pyruvate dehydrogenase complex dihydrolipoamide acetyltransferase [Gemmatimonadaceae bacterium]
MATKVFMEALSPTMEEGRLVKWLKNEGDAVKSGDVLAEVETDKAVMELVARGDGVLRKRLVNEGDARPVGQLVAVIAAPDENIDALLAEAGSAAPAAPPSAAPKEAAPAAQQAPAPAATAAPPEPPAAPPPPAPSPPAASSGPPAPRPPAPPNNGGQVRSSPLARRLASDRGLDISALQGSGPGGRIIKRDIEAAAAAPAAALSAVTRPPVHPSTGQPDFEDIGLTQIRKTIAKRLAESIGPIPTFYLTADIDLTRVTELRAAMLELGEEYKVSVNDVLMKAVATALAQHPEVNAHWLGDRIRYHHRVHLGMAVATNDGLIVPVIFDADRKRMSEISAEARELAKRARERKLKPEEYTGSTFSISNLGMFGIDQFTAIINPPEVGILAIGTAHDVMVPGKGDAGFEVQKRVRITMSCDHRAVDGAVGAAFLQTLRRLIENPLMLVF